MNTYFAIKKAMSQTWDAQGKRWPVTVVKTEPLTVTQIKTVETDGYSSVQLGFGEKKKLTKPLKSHLKKSKSSPRHLKEIRMTEIDHEVGQKVTIEDVFKAGDVVVARSTSKGRGFSGGMKRWGFRGGPRTHGQSDRARAVGSIGQGTSPGRVHKGKKMPGRYGNQQFAIESLTILKVDAENQEVWLSGPIPGPRGTIVTLTKTGEGKEVGLYHEAKEEAEQVIVNEKEDSVAVKTDDQNASDTDNSKKEVEKAEEIVEVVEAKEQSK
jgi:large subunit ribosomal protein L3